MIVFVFDIIDDWIDENGSYFLFLKKIFGELFSMVWLFMMEMEKECVV